MVVDTSPVLCSQAPESCGGGGEGRGVEAADGLAKGKERSAQEEDGSSLSRWRFARDTLTALYCTWRRRAYINSSRLFARRKYMKNTLKRLGGLKLQDMYMMLDNLGKNAGMKEVLGSAAVSAEVKEAYRNLLLCMANVVGTDAHRTVLRHMNNS